MFMSVFNFTVKNGPKHYKGLKHPKMPQAIKLNNIYSLKVLVSFSIIGNNGI